MENKIIKVKVDSSGIATFEGENYSQQQLDFSSDDSQNIQNFYGTIFEYIYVNEKKPEFKMEEVVENEKNNLYYEVVNEYITDINSEINSSYSNIMEIKQKKTEINNMKANLEV